MLIQNELDGTSEVKENIMKVHWHKFHNAKYSQY